MNNWLTFIIAILATYRISHLIAVETGPWRLCERLRGAVGQRWGYQSWQVEGISCVLCVSFWVSLVAALPCEIWFMAWSGIRNDAATVYPWTYNTVIWLWFFALWVGIAGGVLVLHKAVSRD